MCVVIMFRRFDFNIRDEMKGQGINKQRKNIFARIVATILLCTQFLQITAAVASSTASIFPSSSSYYQTNKPITNNTPITAGPFL